LAKKIHNNGMSIYPKFQAFSCRARKMLLKGVKAADIADFTGLSKAQITKLSKTKKKRE